MILSDVFEVSVRGTVDGETADNVFHIQPVAFPGNLPPSGEAETQECLQQWVDGWVGAMQNAAAEFSTLFLVQSWDAYMLFDPVSIYGGPVTSSPQVIGTGANLVSPFATYSLYSQSKRRGQNGGHKSLAGVIEGAVSNGSLVSGTVSALTDEVCTWLNSPQNVGVSLDFIVDFTVVIVKRVFVPATLTHKAYYRLPNNTAEYNGYKADNWVVQADMSTRNSRKRGRGT